MKYPQNFKGLGKLNKKLPDQTPCKWRHNQLKVIKIKNYIQMFLIYVETGWWLALEFLDFLELFLDFFVLVKSLKKGFLNTIFLKFSQFFLLLCSMFSHILLFWTYAKCLNFKPSAQFKHIAYAVVHMFSNQCRQNNMLWLDSSFF